jgi:hypothetical protein
MGNAVGIFGAVKMSPCWAGISLAWQQSVELQKLPVRSYVYDCDQDRRLTTRDTENMENMDNFCSEVKLSDVPKVSKYLNFKL